MGVEADSPMAILFDPEQFAKVALDNHTLSWHNVEQYISGKDRKKIKVPFEIGADVLLKYSQPEKSELMIKVGQLVREARRQSGLSQQELALMSGTSRSYISRIENDRSDIELATLRKVVETGLGKRLKISIK
jgi:ribosome-binding protein aMBF1 (putative translation factor)